jgi:hypothetical protein
MDYILESELASHVTAALSAVAKGIKDARCLDPKFGAINAPDGIEFVINVLVDGRENAVMTLQEDTGTDKVVTNVTPEVVSTSVRDAAESTTTRTDTHEKSVTSDKLLTGNQVATDNGVDTQVTEFEYIS